MDQILAIHEDDLDVVVQPSVQWVDLNEKIASTGLFFPVDPGPSAKIGGMVGTSCSGTNAFRYGTMRDWVLNLTVVLSDGRIIKTRRRPRKSSAGYNLNNLFIGAEGTLGIITEATLKLAVIPPQTKVGVVSFPTIRDAATAAMRIIRRGIPVAAMEIMDDVQMAVINKAGGTNRTWEEAPTIFFKFSGTDASVQEQIKLTTTILESSKATEMLYARTEQEAHDLWKARKDTLWSMLALKREGDEAWSTDVAVPISRLPDIIGKCFILNANSGEAQKLANFGTKRLRRIKLTLWVSSPACLDTLGTETSTQQFSTMPPMSKNGKRWIEWCTIWLTLH